MNTITMTNHTSDKSDVERLLDEAGIDHVVVDRCPLPTCADCDPTTAGLAPTRVAA